MFVGADAMGLPKRGLISFDVASYFPIDATITDVSLSMVLGQIAGSGGAGSSGSGPTAVTIGLYQVTTLWQGSTNGTTGHTSGFGGTGQGFLANPGDATWAYASYSTTPWASAGGDFVAATRAGASIGPATGMAYTWASTPALIADVQGWLDGAIPNDGLLLKNNDETDLYAYRAFYTREGASEQGALQNAPELAVSYTDVPEPSSFAVLLSGVGLWCSMGGTVAHDDGYAYLGFTQYRHW